MNIFGRNVVLVVAMLLLACLACGCVEQNADRSADDLSLEGLGPTIGSLTRIVTPEPVKVEGYGLVSGLRGTGSTECPPRIRMYLSRYIRKQLPPGGELDVDKYIDRPDTAAVPVEGIVPPMTPRDGYFDVLVSALPGTQTTSLEGGWLFETELKVAGSFGVAVGVPADAKGPIYTDKLGEIRVDSKIGHILAGGKVLGEYRIGMALGGSDPVTTNRIRNRINGRFGKGAARAVTAGQIELSVPGRYKRYPQRFVAMVGALYLTQEPELEQRRIATFVRRLAESQDKLASEIALEAIGNQCLEALSVLLESPDEVVRLHAARCTLSLGGDAGLKALRQIALDKNSAFRFEAIVAITAVATRNDAAAISRLLLRDDHFLVRLAAYEQLRELDDAAVAQEQVAGTFYIERVAQTDEKVIFVTRTGQPRVVLFGTPISCRGNIFLGSADGDITINAPAGAKYVTIIRKHPKRPDVIAQLKSTFEVGDIVRTLCDEPLKEGEEGREGLGVSYADAVVLLKQMCDKSAVQAVFHAGPMPNFGLNIKK
ncbi:MAG: flagellar basal body P-ring protein FlgI [Planctomycetota bacterium]|jgi:hypothetical protein